MSKCKVCDGAEFVNVEAVRFAGDDEYLRPSSFCFQAKFCPECGKRLKDWPVSKGGENGR